MDNLFKEWSIDFDYVAGIWGRASTEPVLSSTPALCWWKRRSRSYMPNVVDSARLFGCTRVHGCNLSVVAEVTDRIFYIKAHFKNAFLNTPETVLQLYYCGN